jgi:hypothetical protein
MGHASLVPLAPLLDPDPVFRFSFIIPLRRGAETLRSGSAGGSTNFSLAEGENSYNFVCAR